jgi:four helix bundle protein
MPKDPKYDLIERTAKFGEDVIKFCKKVPRDPITDPLIIQLVKCGTSVGANCSEADDAESKQILNIRLEFAKKSLGNVSTSYV